MKLRPAPIDDPQKISVDPINTMDSGGWYLCFERPNVKRSIDADNPATFEVNAKNKSDEAIVLSVTQAINGGDIGFADRLKRTRQAKIILLDSTLLIDFKDK